MRILIADVKRNIAHAAVALGQQMLCRLDADSGQILDKGLSGLLREHSGEMIRAEADFLRTDYDRIFFFSKSIGTAIAVRYAVLHGLHPGQVYFTPIEAALPDLDPAGIAFHGTADPWANTEMITNGCRKIGILLYLTENANHSMETGDTLHDIFILHDIMDETAHWMDSPA